MKGRVALLAALAVLAGALAGGRADTSEDGFAELFNGKDLTGWQYKGSKENLEGKTATADERVKVEDGIIVMQPKDNKGKGGIKDLYTVKTFAKNFHLRVEFRASPKSDSGVYVRGPQLQVRDFPRLGQMKHLKRFKNDDWNTLDIVVKNNVLVSTVNRKALAPTDSFELTYKQGKASASLNGKPVDPRNVEVRHANVAECTINGEPLETMTNIPASGGIGLQAEDGKFEFRKVRIKELQ